MEQDLIVPLGGGLSITKLVAWSVSGLSPEGSPMVEIYLDLWKDKYGTNLFRVDITSG